MPCWPLPALAATAWHCILGEFVCALVWTSPRYTLASLKVNNPRNAADVAHAVRTNVNLAKDFLRLREAAKLLGVSHPMGNSRGQQQVGLGWAARVACSKSTPVFRISKPIEEFAFARFFDTPGRQLRACCGWWDQQTLPAVAG